MEELPDAKDDVSSRLEKIDELWNTLHDVSAFFALEIFVWLLYLVKSAFLHKNLVINSTFVDQTIKGVLKSCFLFVHG